MTKQIINCETGEIIERDLTKEELAQQKVDEKKAAEIQNEIDLQMAARQAILNRLGLTEEEARLLLG